MTPVTELNPALRSSETVLNPDLPEEKPSDGVTELNPLTPDGGTSATALNPDLMEDPHKALEGALLDGRYLVEERLQVDSGEASLYICSLDGERYIAKIYKRKFAVKKEVLDALANIDCPYVAKVRESFDLNGYPVEIIPYYKNGSLQNTLCTFDELKDVIIPDVTEALRALHAAGILHKDVKPANLMRCDDGKHIALIDFGISSVLEEGRTVLITRTGMTPEYSAPETFKNIFLEESDYYSLGITLFELFSGRTPYANMTAEEIEQYVSVQRIPFPEGMPAALCSLIAALTYYDITNRRAKDNPNRRWTYEEVQRWLRGEDQVLPGEGVDKKPLPPYPFLGREYATVAELAAAFAKNWDQGKKQLFRGLAAKHFRPYLPETARICAEAEAEAAASSGRDDVIFWKFLYRLDPGLNGFYWKNRTFESLPALGRELLEQLWAGDHSQFAYHETVLKEKLLTAYAETVAPEDEALRAAAKAIEDSYELEVLNRTDLRRTFFLMAYTLSGQKILQLDGEQFRTVEEFAGYLRGRLDKSYKTFEKLCHRLAGYDGSLDVQLETWLIAIGKQTELERWRALINE